MSTKNPSAKVIAAATSEIVRAAAQIVGQEESSQQIDRSSTPVGITATMAGISKAVN